MLSTEPLTTYDLDEIGHTSFRADRPLQVAAELVDAVEQGWLADQADTGYALILAAEIMERAGDLPAAEALAERAVAAYQAHRDPGYGYPRAFRAGLLMQLGREDEAMAELTALRPLLSQDADAVSYISETLEECGHAEIAEQWLTAALAPALRRREALESQRATPAYEQAAMLAFSLIQNRHRVRRDLDLPHDAQDDLADQLAEAVEQALGDDELELKGVAVLFWPQPEFDRLLQRWPVLADVYGRTWDEHRAILQRTLMQLAESGHTRLAVLPGAAEELARYASRNGEEPTEPQVRRDYAEYLGDQAAQLIWPPGRNQSCWCDSGLKYKKCCLPRTRD
ncbi:MAG TPA: SEC-C metal-binding domain-containing protein [Pseudonocardiaceae bacterium]|nr:SEC-C metal-binding domain-containing protein [Pseudonocardiaceae bacterium]